LLPDDSPIEDGRFSSAFESAIRDAIAEQIMAEIDRRAD
jgi:hypothetical protein